MHGLICFLADDLEFNGIGGRCWDWWTLLRSVDFACFGECFLGGLRGELIRSLEGDYECPGPTSYHLTDCWQPRNREAESRTSQPCKEDKIGNSRTGRRLEWQVTPRAAWWPSYMFLSLNSRTLFFKPNLQNMQNGSGSAVFFAFS